MGVAAGVVLVVEDDFLLRLSAAEIVERAGFGALQAADADEAIAILEANPEIRLVFTDIEMPGSMDGLKLARYVRERWPPIRILVASGQAILEEAALPSGGRFFSKPYDEQRIAQALQEMLGHQV